MRLWSMGQRFAITRDVFGNHYDELLAEIVERGDQGIAISAAEMRALWREALEPPADVRESKILMLQWTLLYLRSWNPLVFWASIAGGAFASATLFYKLLHALMS